MNNKQKQQILENVKLKISISNFEKEEKIEMKRTRKSILKIAAVACCTMISITGVVFAKDIGNFVKEFFGANSSDGVDTAVNNGYVADANTEYQNAEGIELKVESVLMDDFNFDMNFSVRISEKYDIKEFERLKFGDLIIKDEEGRIVFNQYGSKVETEEMKGKTYMGAYSISPQKIREDEIKVSLSATGNPTEFPRSKKLIVTLDNINTSKASYQGDWEFKVDVPKEMYNRETVIYRAISCSDENINIEQIDATLSNTALKLYIPTAKTNKVDYELLKSENPKSIYDWIAFNKEYVETSDGKRFEISQKSDGDGGYTVPHGEDIIVDYRQTFNLTKYDATDEITIHIFTNKREEIIIKLERAK